jgi:hypothetical protein
MPRQISPSQEKLWNSLQCRIDRLNQEKVRLLDEWAQAMKRVYLVPACYRYDAIQVVDERYSDLIDAIESHIRTIGSA